MDGMDKVDRMDFLFSHAETLSRREHGNTECHAIGFLLEYHVGIDRDPC